MQFRHPTLFALAALACAATASAQQSILLNDTFTNSVRVGTAPGVSGIDRDGLGPLTNDYAIVTNGSADMATSSINDYASNIGTGINGNSLFLVNNASAFAAVTTFASTTLNPGDSLTLTLNIRTTTGNLKSSGTGAFRIGLFNNGGTVNASNTSSFSGFPTTTFNDDTAYIANYSTNASGFLTGQAQERAAGSAQNLFAGTLASVGSASATGSTVVSFDTTYAVSLGLTRSLDGNSMSVTSSFNGVAVSGTDSTSPYTTFNQLGIFFGSPWGDATTPRTNFIDDVTVTYSAVPEPSTSAVLVGLGALGLVALRRRRST